MNIGVIGLGLIGGSLAKDLKILGHTVVGYDQDPQHIQQALRLGLIEAATEIEVLARDSDFLIVSIPVNQTGSVINQLLDLIAHDKIIIDTASTKRSICVAVQDNPMRGRYVACHPLAGTEHSGPTAAISGLYDG